jgi:hypothetical protein
MVSTYTPQIGNIQGTYIRLSGKNIAGEESEFLGTG